MPVEWQDGWPRLTAPGQAIPWTRQGPNLPSGRRPAIPTSGAFIVRDEFNGAHLPYYWMMLRNPNERWYRLGGGTLQLDPRPVGFGELGNPSLLARRQQHLNAVATTRVRFSPVEGGEAGLVALQNDNYWYFLAIGLDAGKPVIRVRKRAGDRDPAEGVVLRIAPLASDAPIELRIAARGGSYDFSFSEDGRHWQMLLSGADGTILSTKRSGGFVGSVFGLYAHSNLAKGTSR
jgi:alpha-N-arabinofuranosidase